MKLSVKYFYGGLIKRIKMEIIDIRITIKRMHISMLFDFAVLRIGDEKYHRTASHNCRLGIAILHAVQENID